MKAKYVFFMFVFFVALISVVLFFKDKEISKLENKLEQVAPPETVSVEIIQHDTVFVREADTVEIETEVRGDTVYVYKKMYDFFEQPLFDLGIWANSRTEEFTYDLKYRHLKVYFLFKNKLDLRKGFDVYTDPNIGEVKVDWGDYTPIKKPRSFGVNLGLGYSKQLGPFILSDVEWRKFAFGVFLKEESYGFYVRRQIW